VRLQKESLRLLSSCSIISFIDSVVDVFVILGEVVVDDDSLTPSPMPITTLWLLLPARLPLLTWNTARLKLLSLLNTVLVDVVLVEIDVVEVLKSTLQSLDSRQS
jgi:hypothetical protein